MKQSMQLLTSSLTNKWYTPPEETDRAGGVLGGIGLDPASDPIPQLWIQAGSYYTIHDNGLIQDWTCDTLFMNSPYGKTGTKSNQEIWGKLLVKNYQEGKVGAAIMLTKTVPGYDWWDRFFSGGWPGPVCITTGRLSFIPSDALALYGSIPGLSIKDHLPYLLARYYQNKSKNKSKAASSFWYCGPHWDRFRRAYSKVGRVIFPPKRTSKIFIGQVQPAETSRIIPVPLESGFIVSA